MPWGLPRGGGMGDFGIDGTLHLECTFSKKTYCAMHMRGSYLLGNSTDRCLVSTSSGWGVAFGVKKT